MIATDLDPVLAVLHDQHFRSAGATPDGVFYARCYQCRRVVEVGPRFVTLTGVRQVLSAGIRLAYVVRHRSVCRLR
jgi:hypothetical protein